MIYLMGDSGMTGESFASWDEAFDWLTENLGPLKPSFRRAVKNGKHVQIGCRCYVFIPEGKAEQAIA